MATRRYEGAGSLKVRSLKYEMVQGASVGASQGGPRGDHTTGHVYHTGN